MLTRVTAIALNAYREAVRARILHGLFALALATAGYALVVGAYATRSRMRVVSDLGSASVSLYAIVVAVVLGATSLYRELELKTIFPILARPIRRAEYLVGKLCGTVLTLAVFIGTNSGALLIAIGILSGRSPVLVSLGLALAAALVAGLAWKLPRWRSYLPMLGALLLMAAGFWLAGGAPDDRRVVVGSALLTLCEVLVVASLATLFSAFSSPFLTAVFTLSVFVVGRSADTLAKLPARVFGSLIHDLGAALAKVVPNLMWYVPPRTLLTGEAVGDSLSTHLLLAAAYAGAWAVALLTVASVVFKRRVFVIARRASLALTFLVLALGAMTFRVVHDGEAALAESNVAFNRGDLAGAVLHARRAAIAYAPGAPHTRAALARLRAVAVGSEGVGDIASARLAWGAIRAAAVETRFLVEPYRAERDEADQALARLLAVAPSADPDARARAVVKAREALARIPGPAPGDSLLLLVGFGLSGLGFGLVAWRGLTREGRVIPREFALGALVFALGVACWTFAAYRA